MAFFAVRGATGGIVLIEREGITRAHTSTCQRRPGVWYYKSRCFWIQPAAAAAGDCRQNRPEANIIAAVMVEEDESCYGGSILAALPLPIASKVTHLVTRCNCVAGCRLYLEAMKAFHLYDSSDGTWLPRHAPWAVADNVKR